MTFGLVLQVIVSGLSAGAVYGLVGIGFALVWRLTRTLNLAHGDLAGAAIFISLLVASGRVGRAGVGLAPALAGLAVGTIAAAALGAGLYFAAVRPFFRRGSAVGWIGATVAVAFAIQGALAVVFPQEAYVPPDPLGLSHLAPISLGGGVSIPIRTIVVLGIGLILAAAASRVLERGRYGTAVQAIASDPMAAQMVGLPVDRLITIAFAIAGALAAVAGVVGAPSAGSVAATTGVVLGLKAIAAALLAGMGSTKRVFAFALMLGVLEAAVTSLHVPGFPRLALGPAWHDVAPLLLVPIVLALRPGRFAEEAPE